MSAAAVPPAEGDVELLPLADRAQAVALARLHPRIFPAAASTRLGERYLTAYFDWYRRAPGAFALVARRERELGYVLGSPYGSERARYRALLGVAAGAVLARPRLWLERDVRRVARWRFGSLARATTRRAVAALPAPVMLLDLIGVEPHARRRGIAGRLLDGFADAARDRGARTLLLWVHRDATGARRAYERRGWKEAWAVWPDRSAYLRES